MRVFQICKAVIVLICLLLLSTCGGGSGEGEDASSTFQIIAIPVYPVNQGTHEGQQIEEVVTWRITITAVDIEQSIEEEFPAETRSVTIMVPIGENRLFTVYGLTATGTIAMLGSRTINVTAGVIIRIEPQDACQQPQFVDIGNQQVQWGETLSFTLEATVSGGGTVTYEPGQNVPPDTLTSDGVFTWTPTPTGDFDVCPRTGVTFLANNDCDPESGFEPGRSESTAITLTVTFPGIVLTGPESTTVNPGEPVQFDLTITDTATLAGRNLTYSAQNLPDGATLVNNADNTATFTWTPAAPGTFPITFEVTDDLPLCAGGPRTDTQEISILVEEFEPLAITCSPVGGTTFCDCAGGVVIGVNLIGNVTGSFTFDYTPKLEGTILNPDPSNSRRAVFSWSPAELAVLPSGIFPFTFTVTGELGQTGSTVCTVRIAPCSIPPTLTTIDDQQVIDGTIANPIEVDEGENFSFTVVASDPSLDSGDVLTMSFPEFFDIAEKQIYPQFNQTITVGKIGNNEWLFTWQDPHWAMPPHTYYPYLEIRVRFTIQDRCGNTDSALARLIIAGGYYSMVQKVPEAAFNSGDKEINFITSHVFQKTPNSLSQMLILGSLSDDRGISVFYSPHGRDVQKVELQDPGTGEYLNSSTGASIDGFMYVGTQKTNDHDSATSAKIYRTVNPSSDMSEWEVLEINDPGLDSLSEVTSITKFNNMIFVSATGADGPAVVFSSDRGKTWQSTTGAGMKENERFSVMTVFLDALYVGTRNRNGAEIWRLSKASGGDRFAWERVDNGAFAQHGIREVTSFHSFKGHLYAGGCGEAGLVFCARNGTDWQPTSIPNFGKKSNLHITCVDSLGGSLYAFANVESEMRSLIYVSEDGFSWSKEPTHTLSSSQITGVTKFGGCIYIGAKALSGPELWRLK